MYERKLGAHAPESSQDALQASTGAANGETGPERSSGVTMGREAHSNSTDSTSPRPRIKLPPRPAQSPPSRFSSERASSPAGASPYAVVPRLPSTALEESTIAYNQVQLSRLVRETESQMSSFPPPVNREGDSTFVDRPQRSMDDPHAGRADASANEDEVTTAFVNPRYFRDLANARARDTIIDEGPKRIPSRLALETADGLPGVNSDAFVPAVQSERTAPAIKRSSLAPRRSPTRSRTWSQVALGISCSVLAAALIVLLPVAFGRKPLGAPWLQWRSSSTSAVAPRPPSPEFVELDIEVRPAHARLYLDGHDASNPLKVAYPLDHLDHEVRAEADGFQSRIEHVKFNRDLVVQISLAPLVPPKP